MRKHVVYFYFIMRFHRHRQRRPLSRAQSHICAGPSLAGGLYSHCHSRFCCQLQCCPMTRGPCHTSCGKHPLAGAELRQATLPQETLKQPSFRSIRVVCPIAQLFFGWTVGSANVLAHTRRKLSLLAWSQYLASPGPPQPSRTRPSAKWSRQRPQQSSPKMFLVSGHSSLCMGHME